MFWFCSFWKTKDVFKITLTFFSSSDVEIKHADDYNDLERKKFVFATVNKTQKQFCNSHILCLWNVKQENHVLFYYHRKTALMSHSYTPSYHQHKHTHTHYPTFSRHSTSHSAIHLLIENDLVRFGRYFSYDANNFNSRRRRFHHHHHFVCQLQQNIHQHIFIPARDFHWRFYEFFAFFELINKYHFTREKNHIRLDLNKSRGVRWFIFFMVMICIKFVCAGARERERDNHQAFVCMCAQSNFVHICNA